MTDFLICYDISNPKRLGRVHRCIKKWALPIQYSVFLFTGSQRQLDRCLEQLLSIIDEKADDLRCYPLPHQGRRQRLGKPVLPTGIVHTDLPTQQHVL